MAICWIYVALLVLTIVPVQTFGGQVLPYTSFGIVQNVKLSHTFMSLRPRTHYQCCLECTSHSQCSAVNFYKSDGICELNDKNPMDYPYFNVSEILGWSVFYQNLDPCEKDWILYDRSCYRFFATDNDRSISNEACISMNADLVEFDTVEENEYIYNMAMSLGLGSFWIGLNDFLTEGEFIWPSGNPMTFHFWGVAEPSNGGGSAPPENCVELHSLNYWNDRDCSNAIHSVCEKKHY